MVSKRNINSFMFAQIPLINLNGLKRLQSHIRTYIHRHAAPRKTRLESNLKCNSNNIDSE